MDKYHGQELTLFENAVNWKRYFASFISPYITGDILEVGAGLGGTTKVLVQNNHISWTCLEPDKSLADKIEKLVLQHTLPINCSVVHGTLLEHNFQQEFDTILYIDVIEHIKEDENEIKRSVQFLKKGGALIILVPAYSWLFSPFDKSVGHFRRYTKKSIRTIIPSELKETEMFYLDLLGVLASLTNKYILKKSNPSVKEIQLWDKYIIPVSRLIDPLTGYTAGRSLIGIWKK